jgi:hypothetical protein
MTDRAAEDFPCEFPVDRTLSHEAKAFANTLARILARQNHIPRQMTHSSDDKPLQLKVPRSEETGDLSA